MFDAQCHLELLTLKGIKSLDFIQKKNLKLNYDRIKVSFKNFP